MIGQSHTVGSFLINILNCTMELINKTNNMILLNFIVNRTLQIIKLLNISSIQRITGTAK